MRLTNQSNIKIIPGIYYFSIVIFFLLIFLNYQLEGAFMSSTYHFYFLLGGILLFLFYVYFAWKYFEYDGGGEVIVFLNRGAVLSNFLSYRRKTIEVKRNDIVGYKIYNFIIYKRLIIYYKRRRRTFKKHCNISFVSPKKINYLRQSLDKLISKNKL